MMLSTCALTSARPAFAAISGPRVQRKSCVVCCAAQEQQQQQQQRVPLAAHIGGALSALAAASLVFSASPAMASGVRLPPIDRDPKRCERAFVGNTIGQANAVSDKMLDLRQCELKGANLSGLTLAGALMDKDTDLSNSNMREAVLTKAYAVDAKLSGTDMTNAVVDRVAFDGADLTGVKFINAVITGTTFDGADLSNATFEDALIGSEDAKRLCSNPTLVGDARYEVGCRK